MYELNASTDVSEESVCL